MKIIDKHNIKILKELLRDSSQLLSKIGKAVRLSRENVYYRIQNLTKKGIIRKFVTDIDYRKLGYSQYVVFLEFEKIRPEKEKEVIKYLENDDHISWIGILSGKWSLTFDIYAKNTNELNKIISQVLNKFPQQIGEYLILELSDSEYFFNKIINTNSSKPELHSKKIARGPLKLDNADMKILKQLNDNSRKTYVEIANLLHLNPNTIKNRIKNLEKNEIIQGYSLSINHRYFEYEWHGLQIKLRRASKEIEEKMISYFRNHPRIIFYYSYTKLGAYDFDIGVIVKNATELRDFINEIRSEFYEEMKIENTFLVLEEVSSYSLPSAVFR